jgi:hypothetical protein
LARVHIGAALALLRHTATPHVSDRIRETAVKAGLMWPCVCDFANGPDVDLCRECGKDRLWTADETPHNTNRELLEHLRGALCRWYDEHELLARPAAVSFERIHDDDGPVWADDRVRLHFTDRSEGVPMHGTFDRTEVAYALARISQGHPPRSGDTLLVTVPALVAMSPVL